MSLHDLAARRQRPVDLHPVCVYCGAALNLPHARVGDEDRCDECEDAQSEALCARIEERLRSATTAS